jgi:propanol-preferring alcohol dehydrogenase
VDTRDEALRMADEVGADVTMPSGHDTVGLIRKETAGLGADLVPDFVEG